MRTSARSGCSITHAPFESGSCKQASWTTTHTFVQYCGVHPRSMDSHAWKAKNGTTNCNATIV
eukprot:3377214-Pyramimonas_sp.AAC.1